MDKKEPNKNENWKSGARTVIYAMAGFYLLTMAYNLFKAISSSKGNEQLIMIVFTILFTIIGLGMVIWGLSASYKRSKEQWEARNNTIDQNDESEEK